MVKGFRDLEVWQRSMTLAEHIYTLTRLFPDSEKFGLVSQMQRCAVSIPSNIAEGCGRSSTKEFLQFLAVARGSLMELETQLTLAVRVGLIPRDNALPIWEVAEQVAQMLSKLISSLRAKLKIAKNSSRATKHEPRITP